MLILGIETSCDETACAILKEENNEFSILSSVISSQIKLHSKWGGVVPNLAAREHLKNIVPVINKSLKIAGVDFKKIDLISVTNGPGLIPSLLVGTSAAKTLSYIWEKPLIGIHHIEGHIYANLIQKKEDFKSKIKKPQFPILCLVVSGGHTQLVLMKKNLKYKIIGETLDDAVGEAFDKVARTLGLNYPGGPAIAKEAKKFKDLKNKKINLPRPMINSKNLNFSFSGLKTAVLYMARKNKENLKKENFVFEVCHEFQQATIDVLISKTLKATRLFKPKTIMLAGGVSANLELRKQMEDKIKNNFPNIDCFFPETKYCLDNAAMIAVAGFFHWNEKKTDKKFIKKINSNWKEIETDANLKLS